ncbi:MAG: hypothetical protein ACFFED_00695 [Candidatus Thorarchaeota archaeon]
MDDIGSGEQHRPCEEILLDPERGKLVFDWRAVSRRPIRFLRVSGPLLTAHHPFCSQYEGHIFSFLGRKWCVGCFFNTLSFFSSLFILLLLWFFSPFQFDRGLMLYGGIIGVIISFVFSAAGLTENKKLKAISKLILGTSFSLVVVSILIAGGDILVQLDMKALLIIIVYLPVIGLLSAKRLLEMQKECEACEYKMRWGKCPGFRDILCDYINNGFLLPEELPPST